MGVNTPTEKNVTTYLLLAKNDINSMSS
jgi:hypothetical protein